MDPESKKLLEETYKFSEENNKMLHKMRRAQRWATFLSSLKWLVIIRIGLGSFYFFQPFLEKGMEAYNSISGISQKLK